MSDILKIEYCYSQDYIDSVFVGTGDRPAMRQEINIEATALTREARAAWAEGVRVYGITFDGTPGPQEISAKLVGIHRKQLEEREAQRLSKQARIDEACARILEIEAMNDEGIESARLPDIVDLPPGEWSQRHHRLARRAAELQEARREAQKQARENDKREWIALHGSDHLKRAYEAGYDCLRKYAEERAAFEYPDLELDFDDEAQWGDRSCPSMRALDEMEAAPGSTVVWIKARHDRDPEAWDDYEGEEAVLVRNFLGKYDLIKYLGDPEA